VAIYLIAIVNFFFSNLMLRWLIYSCQKFIIPMYLIAQSKYFGIIHIVDLLSNILKLTGHGISFSVKCFLLILFSGFRAYGRILFLKGCLKKVQPFLLVYEPFPFSKFNNAKGTFSCYAKSPVSSLYMNSRYKIIYCKDKALCRYFIFLMSGWDC